jgi:hypothetical protein
MVAPPSTHSLEDGNQLRNGVCSQDGRFRAGFGREVGAGDGNISDLTWKDFDLAVTDTPWQNGEPRELQCPTVKGMRWIDNRDLTFAFLRYQRGITLGGVFRFQ